MKPVMLKVSGSIEAPKPGTAPIIRCDLPSLLGMMPFKGGAGVLTMVSTISSLTTRMISRMIVIMKETAMQSMLPLSYFTTSFEAAIEGPPGETFI